MVVRKVRNDTPPSKGRQNHGGADRDIDDLHKAMVERTVSARRRNNVDNVRAALQHIRTSGSTDYGIANVAAAVAVLGHASPKEQTIRNAGGEDFRELIAAYRKAFGKPEKEAVAGGDSDLAAAVPDIKARARFEWLVAENRSLKRRLDLLHNLVGTMQPVRDVQLSDGTRLALAPEHAMTPVPNGGGLSSEERRAVIQFIERVEDWGCHFDEDSGALLVAEGELEVAPPRFLHALRRIVS